MRLVTENRLPNEGEFVIIRSVTITGEIFIGIVVLDVDGCYYLLSDFLEGQQCDGSRYGFRCSWVLDPDAISPLGFSARSLHADESYIGTEGDLELLPIEVRESLELSADSANEQDEEVTEFISSLYTAEHLYEGQHCYHAHHGDVMNLPQRPYHGHRIGIELEVEFNTDAARRTFNQIQSNWFYRESDGSLGAHGCEIITIPLLPTDAKSEEFWMPLCRYLKSRASSWNTGRCGLHVHIGREILGKTAEIQSETIGRLLYLYHHWLKDTRLNIDIYGRERGYNDRDGKTDAGKVAAIFGKDVLKNKNICGKLKDEMIYKNTDNRYYDINLMNTYTIEFRKGRGSINQKRIAMVVEYCERMCHYARTTPWTQIDYNDFVNYLQATTHNPDLLSRIERFR